MSSCLGLYIEKNIIKYAKVSKDHDQIKVESFGTKFYDNIDETIKQIIEETYSFKSSISINLSEEIYNYFNMFALLNKKDLPRAIKTEFESYCSEKKYNPNAFETRYVVAPNTKDKEKLKVIHISDNKIELNKNIQRFSAYKLQAVSPISMTIPNLKEFDVKENALIVNIEEKTTITTILDQKIYNIKKIENGSQEILDKINLKENSYAKAYEICKETTIYTSDGKELTDMETSYLEDIMPTLYEIVGQIRKTINESEEKIDKVYITGTAALINNIDLYFEEYLENIKCEILRPNFIKISPEINIKDYVEVNSAISLALSELGQGIAGINFKKSNFMDGLPEFFKLEIGSKDKKTKSESKLKNKIIINDLNMPITNQEKILIRITATILILFIVYSGFTIMLKQQINKKLEEAKQSVNNTKEQIELINTDKQKIQTKVSDYQTKLTELTQLEEKQQEITSARKQIPNLLNKLMYIMPDGVQITSIQNTTNKHIEIQAQSKKYEQLGYLTANIQVEPVLTNVISTAGRKENNIVTIKIEGDLP